LAEDKQITVEEKFLDSIAETDADDLDDPEYEDYDFSPIDSHSRQGPC
jgi:hypothetical protein